jgi:NAD(P)-dependent dehydrogenase (short-subunit alcohol dehydrogenase family)
VAELLAGLGAGVVVNGRDGTAVSEAVERIGRSATGFAGSPADPATADALIASCVAEFGGTDILINCAGTAEPAGSSILNVTSAQFRELLDAHLGTAFETCRAAAPRLIERGGGAIVNTSSFAFLGDYGGTGYPAGKGGVNGLTLAIAAELNRRGLLDDVSTQGALDAAPPEYVAPTYAYLVSDLAKDVTGQIFIAAGGFVGRFERATPGIVAYRDHHDSPPWSIDELHGFIHRG